MSDFEVTRRTFIKLLSAAIVTIKAPVLAAGATESAHYHLSNIEVLPSITMLGHVVRGMVNLVGTNRYKYWMIEMDLEPFGGMENAKAKAIELIKPQIVMAFSQENRNV